MSSKNQWRQEPDAQQKKGKAFIFEDVVLCGQKCRRKLTVAEIVCVYCVLWRCVETKICPTNTKIGGMSLTFATIYFTFLQLSRAAAVVVEQQHSSVFSAAGVLLNTPFPTFKQKTGWADCPRVCVRVCVRACSYACVCVKAAGFLLMPVCQERLLLGPEFKRMCVTVASPLSAAACDAPSHKSCCTFQNPRPSAE